MRIRYGGRAYLVVKMQGVGETVKAAPVSTITKIPEFMFTNLVSITMYNERER
jgi:hypothetical protein